MAPNTVAIHAISPSRGSGRSMLPTPASTAPTATSTQALLPVREEARLEHERDGDRRPEQGERRVAGAAQEAEHLDAREAGDEREHERDRPDPEDERDEQDGDEDERRKRAGPQHRR